MPDPLRIRHVVAIAGLPMLARSRASFAFFKRERVYVISAVFSLADVVTNLDVRVTIHKQRPHFTDTLYRLAKSGPAFLDICRSMAGDLGLPDFLAGSPLAVSYPYVPCKCCIIAEFLRSKAIVSHHIFRSFHSVSPAGSG